MTVSGRESLFLKRKWFENIIDAHVKNPFHMDLGIKVFRNYELFKQVMVATT